MYFNHKIYSIVERRCHHCGFSHFYAKEVGKTSIEGTDLSFLREIGSPFYYRSVISDDCVTVDMSRGGGSFTTVSKLNLLKIGKQWYAASQKILNYTDGAPFFKGLIPHKCHFYAQKWGDKGLFEAFELAPLKANHAQKYWACKKCYEKIVAKKDERKSQRSLLCDQKIGCERVYFDPMAEEFLCRGFRVPFGVTYFKNIEGITDHEISYIPHLRLTIGGLYIATVRKYDDRLVVTRRRELS